MFLDKIEIAQQHLSAGVRLLAEGAPAAALESLKRAVELAPGEASIHVNIGFAHAQLHQFEPAQAALRTALAIDPDHPRAVHMLGALLVEYGQAEAGAPYLRRAVALSPDSAATHRDLGATLLFLGELDEARAAMTRAVELDPGAHEILDVLAALQPTNDGSAEAEALYARIEAQAAASDRFDPKMRSEALFAFGRALEDRGEADRAFGCMAEANALRRASLDFDIDEVERRMETIAEVFSAERLASLAGGGDPSPRPIFIVGMPRSGSTLVEQILSAHPQVFGAGESPFLPDILDNSRGLGGALYPYWAEAMRPVDCASIGQLYLQRLPRDAARPDRTTDKWLENFKHLGLIQACLPNAAIVHCRRDPRDSCFSIFAMRFSNGHAFAYDQVELGRYWRAYDGLMAHWTRVLPPGKILEVPYEGVVEDLEGWARRLVAHCGLPWYDACLRFYDSKRQVRSASVAQVRRPIYSASVGRWKPFARHLGPLLETLGEPWNRVEA